MRNVFLVYAIVVTTLFTTMSWSRMIKSAANSSSSSGYRSTSGSSWSSNTGSWSGGGSGHK